jgi:hypothetical protein
MNRIERLIWERTLMNRIERLQRESRFTSGAKVVSVVFLVGMIGLLATRAPVPPFDGSVVQAPVAESSIPAPVAALNPTSTIDPAASTLSRDAADAAARAAPQDDTPIPTF